MLPCGSNTRDSLGNGARGFACLRRDWRASPASLAFFKCIDCKVREARPRWPYTHTFSLSLSLSLFLSLSALSGPPESVRIMLTRRSEIAERGCPPSVTFSPSRRRVSVTLCQVIEMSCQAGENIAPVVCYIILQHDNENLSFPIFFYFQKEQSRISCIFETSTTQLRLGIALSGNNITVLSISLASTLFHSIQDCNW